MPRTRLHPEYVRRNYTYDCTLRGPPPQILWDTARAMQTLWNGLVAAHDALLAPWDERTTKTTKREGYAHFWRQSYAYVRDEGERLALPCWPKWHVFDTFRGALQRWARHQGGRPHAHHGLQRILLPHRTDSGGVPVAWLESDSPRKHTALLPATPGHHHQDGYTTLGETRIPFRLILHRPLPPEALLKRLALLGSFEPALRTATHDGWQWRFQCSVEYPAPEPAPATGRQAGIDLGWRVREEGLRLAVVTDGQITWEWLLPFDLANNRLRRRQRRYAQHHAPLETTGNWRQLWALQSALDDRLEAIKALLTAHERTGWPPEAQALWAQAARVRAGGLRRLRRLLEAAGLVLPALEEWHAAHTVSARRLRGAQLRIFRHREHLYRHLAGWLARHYDVVAWEEDLSLKELAEHVPVDQPALQAARKYRQMAGLSRLRTFIAEALAAQGRTLHPVEAAYTTQDCATCGAPVPPGAELVRTCLHGHVRDQDVNAAMNLWLALPASPDPRAVPVPSVDREQLRRGLVRLG